MYLIFFRRRVEYGLLEDPNDELSDEELISVIAEMKQNMPYCGLQMIFGGLRDKGIKVSRDRVREALSSLDPLHKSTFWPSPTTRRPYSVAGPNSLWHIGMYSNLKSYITRLLFNCRILQKGLNCQSIQQSFGLTKKMVCPYYFEVQDILS